MEKLSPRFKLPPAQIVWHDDTQDFYFAGQLEDYRVMNKLGQGQYGIVKLGVHVGTGERVALKIINKADLSDLERESLKREAEVMSYLNHKNIIRTIAVVENRINLCLVMEFAAGGELFDHIIRQVKLKEVEARNLFVQMLEGIAYCHTKRIIHRDIKAENIFLDEKLEFVKIGDFGFSTVIGDDKEEEACGSLDYAAPEILGGRSHPGPEGDIWALGVVLYFMTTGTLPFKAATDFDVYQKIRKADYRALPGSTSPELIEIIKSVFETNPMTRPSAATILHKSWCQQAFKDPEYLKHPKMHRMLQLQIKQHFHGRVKKMSSTDAIAHGESSGALSPRSMIASVSAPNIHTSSNSSKATPSSSAASAAAPTISLSSKVATAKLARARSSQKAQVAPATANNPVIHEDKTLSSAKRNSSKPSTSSREHNHKAKPKSRDKEKDKDKDKDKDKEKDQSEHKVKDKVEKKDHLDVKDKEAKKSNRGSKKKRTKNEILEEDEEGVEVTEPPVSPRAPTVPLPALLLPAYPKLLPILIPLPPGGNKTPHKSPEAIDASSPQPIIKTAPVDADTELLSSVRSHTRKASIPPPVLPLGNLPIAGNVGSRIKITPTSPRSGRKPATPVSGAVPKGERNSRPSSKQSSPAASPSPSPRRKTSLQVTKDQGQSPRSRKSSVSGRPSRSGMRMSDFSVIKLNQEQLDKLVANKQVEILSVEREGATNVVVVSAPASRRRMNTVRDLLAQFEKNATKLKRSKSIENVNNNVSLFGDISWLTLSGGIVKKKKGGDTPSKAESVSEPIEVEPQSSSPVNRPEVGHLKRGVHRTRSNSYNHETFRELLLKKKQNLPELKVRRSAGREEPAKESAQANPEKPPLPGLTKSADFAKVEIEGSSS